MTPMLGSKLRRDVRCNPSSCVYARSSCSSSPSRSACSPAAAAATTTARRPSADTDVDQLLKDTFSGNKDDQVRQDRPRRSTSTPASRPFDAQAQRPVPEPGRRQAAASSTSTPRSSGGGPEPRGSGVTSTGDQALRELRRDRLRGPGRGLQAVQGRASSSRPSRRGRARTSRWPASGSTREVAHERQERGRGEGRRHRHDQDHRRRRRAEAARRRQRGAASKIRSIGGASAASLPEQLTEQDKQAGRGRDQGPQRRDLHRRRRQDPAPHRRRDEARRVPTDAAPRAVGRRQARPPAARPQRGSGHRGAGRRRSRSRSWRRSSTALGLGSSAASAASPAAASGSGGGADRRQNLEKYSQVHPGRAAATTRRSASAPTCWHAVAADAA